MGVMEEVDGLCGDAFDDGLFEVQVQSGPKPMEGPGLLRKPNPLCGHRWRRLTPKRPALILSLVKL